MKTIAASLLALGLLTGTASAKDIFTDIRDTAPKSLFDQINSTAPRSVFDDIRDTAPRSVFDGIRDTAPRSDGVFGGLQTGSP